MYRKAIPYKELTAMVNEELRKIRCKRQRVKAADKARLTELGSYKEKLRDLKIEETTVKLFQIRLKLLHPVPMSQDAPETWLSDGGKQ